MDTDNHTDSMNEDSKREYVKELIADLESQHKQILLFITFNLSLIAIMINGIGFQDPVLKLSCYEKVVLLS